MRKGARNGYWVTGITLLLMFVLSIAVGSVNISPLELVDTLWQRVAGGSTSSKVYETILFDLRIPRSILMMLTGAALAGSGAAYQGLFRNPLADPYLIGAASGAGLGAVIAMSIQWPYSLAGLLVIPMAAFIGALSTVVVVYWLAHINRVVSTTNLILAGVAVSSFATALTSFLMIQAVDEVRRAIVWLLGGATMSGWLPVIAVLPYVLLGLAGMLVHGHALNVMQFGEEQAQQMGVAVNRVRFFVVASATLATAAAVSFSGIIGFVGLIVPHIIRLVWVNDYRHLIPLSLIAGGALLLFADILARVVLAPQEVPVGILTALAGGPFFLWLLRRNRVNGGS
ncbi:MAG: iron ABC transporter permease [Anaerolineae bacterium]|jgi:iron complex transport system permease protein|nr:iron ABC transporter permease [Anaerolineae bacterium]